MDIIALDAHKRYSQVCVQKQNGQFLAGRPAGANVALETVGNWYWIVDEIGDISRFATPVKLASYSGMVRRVHSSGLSAIDVMSS